MILCELCVKQPLKRNHITSNSLGEYYLHRFNLEFNANEIAENKKDYAKFLKSLFKNTDEILNENYKKNWIDFKIHLFDSECNHIGCLEKSNPKLLN